MRGNVEISKLVFESGKPFVIDVGPSTIKELELQSGGFTLRADSATLPKGLRYHSEEGLTIGELHVDIGSFTIDSLVPAKPETQTTLETPKEKNPDKNLSWIPILDTIRGHLNVDLNLEVKIPVVGSRVGEHKFRVPIVDGIINYKKLEKNLATLENAFIDLAHKNDRLVVERDIPLLPFDAKELVWWQLDEEAAALAVTDEVRLRTLATPVLPPAKPTDPTKEKKRVIVGAAANNIDVQLSLGASEIPLLGGILKLGGPDRDAFSSLQISGEAVYKTKTETPPTRLAASIQEAYMHFAKAKIGRSLYTGSISWASMYEVSIEMNRFIPGKMTGYFRDLSISGLSQRIIS